MLLFSQKRKLAMLFEEWRTGNSNGGVVAANCPENVVSFLCSKGLVDEKKVNEYLAMHQPKIKK